MRLPCGLLAQLLICIALNDKDVVLKVQNKAILLTYCAAVKMCRIIFSYFFKTIFLIFMLDFPFLYNRRTNIQIFMSFCQFLAFWKEKQIKFVSPTKKIKYWYIHCFSRFLI